MKKTILIGIMVLLLSSFVTAECIPVLDSNQYNPGETATVTTTCSEQNEKNQAYALNWTNTTGATHLSVFQNDTGTTPAVAGTAFVESFVIPSDFNGNLSVNLTGTNLEGYDVANVTGLATTDLLITDVTKSSDSYLGRYGSIRYRVDNNAGNPVFNARCIIDVVNGDDVPITQSGSMVPTQSDGYVLKSIYLDASIFQEGRDYKWDVSCGCMNTDNVSSGLIGDCVDTSTGLRTTTFKQAQSQVPFTTNTWLYTNTLVDREVYRMKDGIHICVNVTNVGWSSRIPLQIDYQVRCSADEDNDDDLDRILIVASEKSELRGISSGTTQNQCAHFTIPEFHYLQGRNSECYASTNVRGDVGGEKGSSILAYASTSPLFNITSDELNLDEDWEWVSDTRLQSILNLSDHIDISGKGTGNIDLRIEFHGDDVLSMEDAIDMINLISNVTVYNRTEILNRSQHYEIEFLEDNRVELELRNVTLNKTDGNKGWWNITIDFYDNELRQTEALEGIENKTGTFHFDVNCPEVAPTGRNMQCIITGFVEESQTMEKEVDFTCYIDTERLSSSNFNQMITRAPGQFTREFFVPADFALDSEHTLFCEAGYYNFGSRTETFYDTFRVGPYSVTGAGGGAGGPPPEKSLLDKLLDSLRSIKGYEAVVLILLTLGAAHVANQQKQIRQVKKKKKIIAAKRKKEDEEEEENADNKS